MYVLIGGAGLVGLSLAQSLVELGHTVAIIDKYGSFVRSRDSQS